MNVLTLSLGRNILQPNSRERKRMRAYAEHLEVFHIIVLTRKEHTFKETQHEGNLHIYPTNSKGRFMMLVDAFLIGQKIAKQAHQTPLTISSQDPFEIGLACYLLSVYKNTRFHIQLHGDYFGSSYSRGDSTVRSLRLLCARFLLRRAQGIRVVSLRIKQSLVALGFRAEHITVLPIRPELETFLGAPHHVGEHNPFIFLIASRFAREKNIPLMIRAFKKVAMHHTHIRLRIIGKGEEEKKIQSLISALGITDTVTIIPWTETLEKEMQNADVFLLASDHEAYGLTLVEALAVGLPIITTDVGCVGEVVNDGVQGIVVPVRDEAAFASAMERMLDDVTFRVACSEAGRSTAKALTAQTPEVYARAWVASLS